MRTLFLTILVSWWAYGEGHAAPRKDRPLASEGDRHPAVLNKDEELLEERVEMSEKALELLNASVEDLTGVGTQGTRADQ